ncbi:MULTISPECIES: Ig-like domain-containing protein [unclassified Acinetobacter]|uniref:Ig-like domain-containing protein n=1 Tax=unclassified Acinetobacter TaxID=196816 RepID=UPI00257819E6|nr:MULTISPECIES: Ig-like domain-containing protein [unclassified Acinetobacter]MDM1758551.1 hypothetical protein [Acinetobacter sp. 256-1]MDM1762424.1 hypothetical protein [Acinetobacter sp. 251-1]
MKAADGETSDLVFDGTVCAFEQLVWQDGIASFKELTGLEELLPIITGTSTGGVGPLPWIVGGLVTGGIIAATNDDKSHSEPENEPKVEILDAPKVEIANDQNNDGLLNRSETGGASQLNIIVTIPTGAVTGDIITLKDQSGKAYTHTLTQADIDAGKITVQVEKPAEGTELKVTATITNEGGTSAESVPDQAVIHETAPSVQVEIEADYATGKGKVTFTFSEDIDDFDINDIVINGGKIDPDSLVKNPDGTYSATLSDLKKGTAVEVSVKDGSYTDQAGNAGIEGSDEDVSVKVTAIKPDTVGGGSIVTGVTKPNTEVTLKDPATGKIYTTTSNPDGTWSMTTTDPLQDGSSITVTVPNPDSSNPDQSASDEVPLPFVSIDIVGGDNFINEEELVELTDPATGTVKITGTVSNPTADMTITFNGKKYSGIDVKVNADGTWEINVPVEDINLNGKNTITAKGQVTDSTGTVFPSNDAENQVGTDTTPPNVSVSISPEGKITIASDPDVDPSSVETGKITVIDQDGNPVTVTLTPSEDGLTFTGQVPNGFDGKITVTVPDGSYQDLNGNQGNPDQESKAVDTQPPQVIVNIDPNGNITVTFDPDVDPSTIDPNTDFVITDKDGNPLKDKDGNPVTVPLLTSTDGGITWTGKIPEGVEGGVSVTVPEGSYQDKTGNEGGKGTDTENVDTLAPKLTVTIDADGTVHFDFSEVVKGFTSEDILVAGSKLVPGSLTDLGNGKWTAKLDSMPKDGTTVEVTVKDDTYTDLTNNLGSGHQDQVITIKIDSVKPNTDGNAIISGKTEPNQTVTVTVPGSDQPLITTSDANGNWTVTTDFPLKDGNFVTATTPNQDNVIIEDKVKLPFITIDVIAGDDVIDPSERTDIDTQTTMKVSGTISNPNANVTVTFNGVEYSSNSTDPAKKVTVNSDGTWSIQVPADQVGSQNSIEAKVSVVDNGTTIDSAPAVRDPITQGSITVDVDSKGHITGTTLEVVPGQTVELIVIGKDKNGVEIEKKIQATVDSNGQYTAKVPTDFEDGNITVIATTKDANNHPLDAKDAEPALDRTSGSITVDITPDGKITGSTTDVPPGATVELVVEGKDPNGNPVSETMTVTVDSNGHFTSTVPPSIADGGVDVTGTTTDRNGNPLTDTDNEPGLDRTPPAVTVEITPDGNIKVTFDPDIDSSTIDPNTDIVITDKDGNPLKDKDGNPVTVPPLTSTDGGITWTGKVPPNVDTEVKVEVPAKDKDGHPTYVDKIGNPGTGGQATVIVDTLPPTVKVAISEDRTSVNFIFDELIQGFDASDIVVTGGQLKPGTLIENADGTWTAQLQNTEQGTTVEVMVKDQSYTDLVGNVGLGATDTDITIKITSVTSIVGSNDKLITGLTGANQDVTVILPNGTVVEGIRSDEHGYWELTTEILEGTNDQITAQTKNQDEKPIADTISLPFVSIDLVSGNDVINEAEYADFANTVTITGKVSNPDVSMTVTIAGKIYTGSQVTVNADGTWSVNVPKADVAQDFDITAQATSNTSGATSDDASRDVTVDIEPPKVTVDIDTTGKITLKYAPDVDPTSIDLSQVTVKDTLGNVIPVKWNISDSSALNFDAMIEMPVDDIITVTVPKGSYQDLVGNLGLAGSDAEDIDNAAPNIQSSVIKTDEDTSVVITWAHLGIRDNSTDLSKLTISFTQLPANGTLYLNGQAVTDVNVLTGLTKADLDAGQLSFKADLNEASTTADSAYTTLDFEVHDGINTSTGSVDVMVEAVADTPNLSLDLLDWSPTALNLNIKTWEGLKSVTIDGKTYNLLQGNGSGMPADTLKTVFEYLTSDKNTTHKPATSGETSSLADSNVATYKGVAITGYVYLEKGHTYNYKGKADDSGMLIIGNEDPVYVSWGGIKSVCGLQLCRSRVRFLYL